MTVTNDKARARQKMGLACSAPLTGPGGPLWRKWVLKFATCLAQEGMCETASYLLTPVR